MKTLKFGQIEVNGLKSVLIHTAWGFLFAVILAILDTLSHHNWGDLQPFAVPVIVFLTAFVKKTAETYSVTAEDSTVKVTEDTGSVTPEE